jgi:valyl-tRNA synthetase
VLISIDRRARPPRPLPTAVEDRWILSRLRASSDSSHERIDSYDFAHAALELYDFVYGELCDWYLELVKGRGCASRLASCSSTLRFVLRETLTIAIRSCRSSPRRCGSTCASEDEGLLAGVVPARLADSLDRPAGEAALERVIAATQAMRSWRDSVGIKPGVPCSRASTPTATTGSSRCSRGSRASSFERGSTAPSRRRACRSRAGRSRSSTGSTSRAHEQRSARRASARRDLARGQIENGSFAPSSPTRGSSRS